MVKGILSAFLILIVIFALVVSMQPSEFRVTRSTTIPAPADVVFAQVNDFHKWEAWSPWAKLDPNSKITYEGPAAGQGAIMKWAGNKQVGEGMMTITESRPPEYIRLQLDFIKPFAGTSTTEFAFKAEGIQTIVTWTMSGHNNFIGKAMGLIMNCDRMMGGQFEQGLAQLSAVSQKAAGK